MESPVHAIAPSPAVADSISSQTTQESTSKSTQSSSSIPKEIPPNQPEKELLFSGGAGAVGFQMGYCHGLIEIVGKEKLREYRLGGVSAGCAVAAYFFLALHDEQKSMKYSYYNFARRMFEESNKKYFGLFTSCGAVRELSTLYWDILHKDDPELHDLFLSKFHIIVTAVKGLSLKGVCVDSFECRNDFGDAIAASCTIPMVTTFGLTRKFRDMNTVDGGITRPIPFRNENSEIVFLNVLPLALTLFSKVPKDISILCITQNSDVSFPKDFWLWSEHWSDEMFLKGYIASLHDKEAIKKAFKMN